MAWKIYSWIFTGILTLTYATMPPELATPREMIDIPVSVVSLIGLFGFAFKIRIGTTTFWQFWLFTTISWDLVYNFLLTPHSAVSAHKIAIGAIIFVPEYIALYKYSFPQGITGNNRGCTAAGFPPQKIS